MTPKRKRIAEFAIVLVSVALVVIWLNRPESVDPPAPAETAASVETPAAEETPAANYQVSVDGFTLGEPGPDVMPERTVLEFDEQGRIIKIRGDELAYGGKVLARVGDSREQVLEGVGRPSAFAHGGLYWGFWNGSKPSPSNGVLVKFSKRGVEQITLASNWIPLSTELMMSGMNGNPEPVDGSDGYEDLRQFMGGESKVRPPRFTE